MDIDEGFKNMGVEAFIRFSIKANDTPENKKIHETFREFCKIECDNNYTLGLRKLLEYFQTDFKIESLWAAIEDLKMEVLELKEKKEEPPKEEGFF